MSEHFEMQTDPRDEFLYCGTCGAMLISDYSCPECKDRRMQAQDGESISDCGASGHLWRLSTLGTCWVCIRCGESCYGEGSGECP